MMFDIKQYLTENKITLTEKKVNYAALAKKVQKAADKYRDAGKKAFKGEKDMIKMYDDDHRDLTKIAKLILKGKLALAGEMAWYMDTAPREEIPQDVYNIIVDAAQIQ